MSSQVTCLSQAVEFHNVTFAFSQANIFKRIKAIFLPPFNETNALPGLRETAYLFWGPKRKSNDPWMLTRPHVSVTRSTVTSVNP